MKKQKTVSRGKASKAATAEDIRQDVQPEMPRATLLRMPGLPEAKAPGNPWTDEQVDQKANEFFFAEKQATNAIRQLADAYINGLVSSVQLNRVYQLHAEGDEGKRFLNSFKVACARLQVDEKGQTIKGALTVSIDPKSKALKPATVKNRAKSKQDLKTVLRKVCNYTIAHKMDEEAKAKFIASLTACVNNPEEALEKMRQKSE